MATSVEHRSVTIILDDRGQPGILAAAASAEESAQIALAGAEEVRRAAQIVHQTFLTVADQRVYTTDTKGRPLIAATTGHLLLGPSPYGALMLDEDYVLTPDGHPRLSFDPREGELMLLVSMPRVSNTEAQAILQDYVDMLSATPRAWADFADFRDRPTGSILPFNGALFECDPAANITGLPTGPGWKPFGETTVLHFGAVGDCTGVGLGTDDRIAITRAINWVRSGSFRRLVFPAGYKWRISGALTPTTTPAVGTQIIMHSPIVPDPGAYTAMPLFSFRDAEFVLRVQGGGQDADYTQANPVGGSQAFDLRGCRRLTGEIYANSYLGRVLRRSSGGHYKNSFHSLTLDCGDITTSLDAVPCGQGFYFDDAQSAAGGFEYANASWTKYGSVVDSAVDFSLRHWEAGSTHSPNDIRGCGSVWLGTVLGGDETQTQTILRLTANAAGTGCRRVDIGVMQAVQAAVGLDVDNMQASGPGLTVHNLLTNGALEGIRISNAGTVKVLNHDSQGDRNPARLIGAVTLWDHYFSCRSAQREAVLIEATASGVIRLDGISDSPSQEAAGIYAHIKYLSTVARMRCGMVLTGAAKCCVEAAAGAAYRLTGGRFATSPKFVGEEPTSIDHVDGVENNRMLTATIPSGATSVTVAHGLFNTPSYISCSGKHAETASAYASSWDATNITISVPTATTAARAVDVIVARRP